MVLTRHPAVRDSLRRLRDHGSSAKYKHAELGTNSRLHELQAGFLNAKLPYLEAWNARRRTIAARYDAAFGHMSRVRPLAVDAGCEHTYHQYTIRVRARDRVQQDLNARGIVTGVHYPTPVHLQDAAAHLGHAPGSFPAAEALCREVLCLPVHPFLTDEDADRVVEAVLESTLKYGPEPTD
jgi:dTDP-4-amino-4,6-dideoxygalactose transaminase